MNVVRSRTTGKYHASCGNNPAVTYCNYSGQVRRSSNRAATPAEVAKSSAEMFCKKCFPNGKPTCQAV